MVFVRLTIILRRDCGLSAEGATDPRVGNSSRASGGVCSRNAAPQSCRFGIGDSATAPPQRCGDPWARRRCRCLGGRRRRSRITQASEHIQHPRSRTCLKTLAGLRLPRGPRQHASTQAQGSPVSARAIDATGLPGDGALEGARARGWTGSCGCGHTTTTNYVLWARRVRRRSSVGAWRRLVAVVWAFRVHDWQCPGGW